ncbi:MAG: hypothetical protein ABF293_01925 [Flavobacteriaceae bacterium]
MPHILRSGDLEIHVDEPSEGYNFSRFDWTGKITRLRFRNTPLCTTELKGTNFSSRYGMGLYNEFGIDRALGYDDAEPGEWFLKIGVGALKRKPEPYLFSNSYQIEPARFETEHMTSGIVFHCVSDNINGYSYKLRKEILLEDQSLVLNYYLKNIGEKDIVTDEYTHNFMAVNQDPIGEAYVLKFPFELKPGASGEVVDPEKKVEMVDDRIRFLGTPVDQFFFSHLNGQEAVPANWQLEHRESNIRVQETGSFHSGKVNLWGWQHVVSPELFHRFTLNPGESTQWSRTYHIEALP